MQLKDRTTIKIDSVAFGGEGVGRVDNIVVFVPFSAPGDELEIEVTGLKKRFARGRILKIIIPSPFRVEPVCRYYGTCGGCCYQHIDYNYQLIMKRKQVEESFGKIGKIAEPSVSGTIASPRIYHYRGKAQYHVRIVSGRCQTGFMDISGGKLVDIESCAIMEETINRQMRTLREGKGRLCDQNDLTVWSEGFSGGGPDQQSIMRTVKGKNFLVPRDGFFQANLYLTDKMVDEVCRLAAPDKVSTLVDAYCGSGLFSVFLSPYAENITGIEISEQAVQYARINAENLGVKNVEFISGDVGGVLEEKFLSSARKIDLLILDPPRVGCEKTMLNLVKDLRPRKIIYISCNPATQARDVKYLIDCNYELKSLLPLDMFPQTEHIEVIGFLTIK